MNKFDEAEEEIEISRGESCLGLQVDASVSGHSQVMRPIPTTPGPRAQPGSPASLPDGLRG